MENLEEKAKGVKTKTNSENKYSSVKPARSEGFWNYPIALALVAVPLYLMGEDMRYMSYIFLGTTGLIAMVNIYYDYIKK